MAVETRNVRRLAPAGRHPARTSTRLVSGPTRAPRPGRMLVVTAGWGGCFAAISYGLPYAPLLWFAALRSLLAGVVLVAAGLLTRRPAPPRRAWPGIAVLAAVNSAVAFAAMFAGTAEVATGVAAVLANSQPLLIVLPAWMLYRERPSASALAGLAVGFTGLAVTALPGGASRGTLLSIAAAAAITTGTLLARRLRGVDVVMLAGWQFLLGGLLLAVWAGATEDVPAISWTPRFLAVLGFLSLVSTAAAYLVWFTELQRAPLVTLSAWTMLTPVFGVAFGWLLLSERLSTDQGIGIALVLAALAIILIPPTLLPDARSRPVRSAIGKVFARRRLSGAAPLMPTGTPLRWPMLITPAEHLALQEVGGDRSRCCQGTMAPGCQRRGARALACRRLPDLRQPRCQGSLARPTGAAMTAGRAEGPGTGCPCRVRQPATDGGGSLEGSPVSSCASTTGGFLARRVWMPPLEILVAAGHAAPASAGWRGGLVPRNGGEQPDTSPIIGLLPICEERAMPTTTDPVCGMTIEESAAAGSATYEGKTYYFCSSACKGRFEADHGLQNRTSSRQSRDSFRS